MDRALVGVIMIHSSLALLSVIEGTHAFPLGQTLTLTPQSASENASLVNFPRHDETVAPPRTALEESMEDL